jgi:hypothetical protein
MECGSEASAHAEANASALQKWLLPFLAGGRGGLWSAEAKLPPTLKLTLQHSKQVSARLPSPTLWERGWG